MELEESTLWTSDYTTKLQSSRQYGTDKERNLRNIGKWNKLNAQKKTHAPMGTLFLTKEARMYNRAKTASSINGAGKTGQLHIK